MPDIPSTRDVVVVGASAGGLPVLQQLVRDLPGNLPASMFIVQHVGESSLLPDILDRAGPLPVAHAESGEDIQRGRIYVAPPGSHLLLHDGHVLLSRGPRENFSRPAVDPLFRSAAAVFGGRVIGIVLSGALSDGTAGLRAIKRCGGIAVAQDPQDAAVPSMPSSAVRHVELDHCVTAGKMGGLLVALTTQPAGETPEIPFDIRLETLLAAQDIVGKNSSEQLGTISTLTCPQCNGPLWEIADENLLRYRCRIGHAFNADAVLAGQSAEVERILSELLRTNVERAGLARRMAAQERAEGRERSALQLEKRAREYDASAELARQLVRDEGDPLKNLPAVE